MTRFEEPRRMIDISMQLSPATPRWPGSPGVATSILLSLAAGDVANASQLQMDVHTGTHVDAPRHVLDEGATIDELGLGPLVGPAIVAEVDHRGGIDADMLEALPLPADLERLLLRTTNSAREDLRERFAPDYSALTASGARWVVDRGLKLIGIDYLSIQLYEASQETHHVLLRAGVAILEGLDLRGVEPGEYELICLPLRLEGAEAAPARAILRPAGAAHE